MYVDAGFAGDLTDSKSTGGSMVFLVGPSTCIPISWTCKKQGVVSHSSTEAEIISLDMGLRMQGIPALELWDEIQSVMLGFTRAIDLRIPTIHGMYDVLSHVDFVPETCPAPSNLGKLVVLEDNDAVIKMIKKGRTNKLRHVPRTHRIDLDWLFTVMREDPGLKLKYINTKDQVADLFTKGLFTSQLWSHLTLLSGISHSRFEGTTNKKDILILTETANMNGKQRTVDAVPEMGVLAKTLRTTDIVPEKDQRGIDVSCSSFLGSALVTHPAEKFDISSEKDLEEDKEEIFQRNLRLFHHYYSLVFTSFNGGTVDAVRGSFLPNYDCNDVGNFGVRSFANAAVNPSFPDIPFSDAPSENLPDKAEKSLFEEICGDDLGRQNFSEFNVLPIAFTEFPDDNEETMQNPVLSPSLCQSVSGSADTLRVRRTVDTVPESSDF